MSSRMWSRRKISANGTAGALPWQTIDQLVIEASVVPFAMVMRHEIGERPPKMDVLRAGLRD